MPHLTPFPRIDAEVESIKPPDRRSVWRFSLLTLLIVAAMACVAAAFYGMHKREAAALREVAKLRAQADEQQQTIAHLRAELGHLNIDDGAKIHVLEVRTHEELHWKWRIYLPPGRRWKLLGGMGPIPAHGLQGVAHTMSSLDGGEFTLQVLLERDRNDRPRLVYTTPSSTTRLGIAESDYQRLQAQGYDRHSIGTGSLATREPGTPIEVMRLRTREEYVSANGARAYRNSDDPQFGVVIWIEEARPGE